MKPTTWVLIILGALFLLVLLISYGLYRYALVRPRQRKKPKPPTKKWAPLMPRILSGEAYLDSIPGKALHLRAEDGTLLYADYYPAANPSSKKALIAIHGHKSNGKTNFGVFAKFFRDMGYSLLIPDNRAHGKSEGKLIGFGWLDRLDCLAWMKYLRRQLGPDCKILLHGVSMGAATALMTAGEQPENLVGVIADCGFTSAKEQFAHVLHQYYRLPAFPFLSIASAICNLRAGYTFSECSAKAQLKKAQVPILFIHGGKDRFVPTWMSQKMYEDYAGEKELFIAPTADHATSYFFHTREYEQAVRDFLLRHLPGLC